MSSISADTPIQFLRGVGPRRAEAFASLGLRTVGELLEYFPFRHEFEYGEMEIADLEPGITATVRGAIVDVHRRPSAWTVEVDDGAGSCLLRWFNVRAAPRGLVRGANVVATGKVQEYDGILNIVQPRISIFAPDTLMPTQSTGGRRVGVYRATAKLPALAIRRAVDQVLDAEHLPIAEFLPPAVLTKHEWPTRAQAVRAMHRPDDDDRLERARRRMAFEEFFVLELAMALRRRHLRDQLDARRLPVTPEIDERIRARFPFALTADQDRAIREITTDLDTGRPMTRLLQGDVGSGKTVVALYACLVAVAHRRQAAIMAPTEILAAQHFRSIETYLGDSRVRCTLLRGKLARKQRSEALAAIEAGQVDLVVGTQALLERDVAFRDLALVVVDEQHKFGVVQRANFRTKGPLPHCLVMTATPIPRTLAMTVFGDLDVSVIESCPPGRGTVSTFVVAPRQWDGVMRRVREKIEAGEQAYVVCPLIGDDVEDEPAPETRPAGEISRVATNESRAGLASAKDVFERLTKGPWGGLAVGLLHGAQRSDEKQRTIEAFAAGSLEALVSTTVVEVGVDVPNASIMVIENADRFGLSQLHQLRGRIGRGEHDATCVLIARSRGKKAKERLDTLARETNGFRIAEADLRLRGPGELLGTRQSGLPELRFGDLIGDFDVLELARRDAFALIADDPHLKRSEHKGLWPAIERMFQGRLALLDAG